MRLQLLGSKSPLLSKTVEHPYVELRNNTKRQDETSAPADKGSEANKAARYYDAKGWGALFPRLYNLMRIVPELEIKEMKLGFMVQVTKIQDEIIQYLTQNLDFSV